MRPRRTSRRRRRRPAGCDRARDQPGARGAEGVGERSERTLQRAGPARGGGGEPGAGGVDERPSIAVSAPRGRAAKARSSALVRVRSHRDLDRQRAIAGKPEGAREVVRSADRDHRKWNPEVGGKLRRGADRSVSAGDGDPVRAPRDHRLSLVEPEALQLGDARAAALPRPHSPRPTRTPGWRATPSASERQVAPALATLLRALVGGLAGGLERLLASSPALPGRFDAACSPVPSVRSTPFCGHHDIRGSRKASTASITQTPMITAIVMSGPSTYPEAVRRNRAESRP